MGSRFGSRRDKSQLEFEPGRVAPQILEAVKGALLVMENVHDHPGIIRDDPLAGREAIDSERFDTVVVFQTIPQLGGDRLQMRFGSAGTKDEEIGESGNAAEIDGDDVLSFFLRE